MLKITETVKNKLIIGLDVPTVKEAESLICKLGHEAVFYKIGYQLAFCGGLEMAQDLIKSGKKIFLDLKLLDIDNTIAKAVENIAKMNVTMLTIHAYPKAMRAAVAAASGSNLCLLGVTVLTSMDQQDLLNAGYNLTPQELVLSRAKDAALSGMNGVVSSAQEACKIRSVVGDNFFIVTPGIRLLNDKKNDQKRVMSPKDALQAGADYLVVARPIIAAKDPIKAHLEILTQMQQAENI